LNAQNSFDQNARINRGLLPLTCADEELRGQLRDRDDSPPDQRHAQKKQANCLLDAKVLAIEGLN
jgi:hypothetical protein